MSPTIKSGILDMTVAMVLSGTIGWLVLQSGQSPANVVFLRCLIGVPVLALLAYRAGVLAVVRGHTLFLAMIGGVALVLNWLALFS
ncbi:MAG: EamA/RhaT family transporter, partial [Rhizobiaceae bacterium]|nr:EamA/RhaT family transporter [Rhizobiaceae bacterium]